LDGSRSCTTSTSLNHDAQSLRQRDEGKVAAHLGMVERHPEPQRRFDAVRCLHAVPAVKVVWRRCENNRIGALSFCEPFRFVQLHVACFSIDGKGRVEPIG
jgi:hypothetical protein